MMPTASALWGNRLIEVKKNSVSMATFVYNGDGQRVKSVMTTNLGSTTTYFAGAHYEVVEGYTGTQVNKYYYAGSQRIAMRSNGTLYFMLGDHLGSTSLITFANGNVVSETRYKAWGETRYASGTSPTNYTFTGQYSYTGLTRNCRDLATYGIGRKQAIAVQVQVDTLE